MLIKIVKRGEPERTFTCSDITARNIPNTQNLILEFCVTEPDGTLPNGHTRTRRRTVGTAALNKEGDAVFVMDEATGNTVDCYRYRIHGPSGSDGELRRAGIDSSIPPAAADKSADRGGAL